MSRRDFISRGMATGASLVMMPSLLTLLARSSLAQEAPVREAPAILVFDLVGGAALIGNCLVGGRGGARDLLSSYDRLGWNPRAPGAVDERFGLPMASPAVGKMSQGLIEKMSVEAQERFRLCSFAHFASIDTPDNPLSIASLAAFVGRRGTLLTRPVGLIQGYSGGRSRPALDIPEFRAFHVSKYEDLAGITGYPDFGRGMSESAVQSILKALSRLAGSQLERLLARPDQAESKNYLKSVYEKVEPLALSSGEADPRRDPLVREVYQLTEATGTSELSVLRAALVMAALKGATGPAVIPIAGCDYHDGTQATGDVKDLEIGREIGRAIELAHRMGKPLVIHVITDGGIYADPGTRIWRGDAPEKTLSLIGWYRPEGAPKYRRPLGEQIGWFTSQQGADPGSLIGSSAQRSAYAAFANYLNAFGGISEFERILPGVFTASELESLLAFEGA